MVKVPQDRMILGMEMAMEQLTLPMSDITSCV
jgi:hypothetical protein